MSRTNGRPRVIVPLIALAACPAFTSSRAEAQVKPLTITGGGSAPNGLSLIPYTPAPHSATGHASLLGKYTGQGFFQILDFTSPLSGEFSRGPGTGTGPEPGRSRASAH